MAGDDVPLLLLLICREFSRAEVDRPLAPWGVCDQGSDAAQFAEIHTVTGGILGALGGL